MIGDLFAVLGNQALIFFFVISGFLLYRPFVAAHAGQGPRPSTARYARRRAFRILPAYWTALTLLALFPGVTGVFTDQWWRYYFFLQAYSTRTIGGGIPPAWSLCVEVTFYALLPVWAALLRRVSHACQGRWLAVEATMLAALCGLGVMIQVAASRLIVSPLLATTLLGECAWLSIGMGLAVLSVAADRRTSPSRVETLIIKRPGLCWIGAVACLGGATALLHPGGLFNIILALHSKQPLYRSLGGIILSAALSILLVAPAIFGEDRGGIPRRVLAWRPLMGLGVVSYGVYLYHLTVAELLGESSDPQHFSASGLGLVGEIHHFGTPILFVLSLAVSALAASVSYRIVELPFLRRKERVVASAS